MSTKIFLLLCLISISNGDINCRTTAWWVLQPFSKDILRPFLSNCEEGLEFNSSNPLAKYMKNDEHPVYFEFNKQNQCELSSLPSWIADKAEQTFVEFKLQIPYLIRNNKTVMLKPLIYQNSKLNVFASHFVYGLPADFATMNADFENNAYSISYKSGSVHVAFAPLTPVWMSFSSPEAANFSSFVDANISPWLAFCPPPPLGHTKCASNVYNFAQPARIRPVNMILTILGDILQKIPPGIYTKAEIQPLGFDTVPGGPLYANLSVLPYHWYCTTASILSSTLTETETSISCNPQGHLLFDTVDCDIAKTDGSSFLTEFGFDERTPTGAQQNYFTLDKCDQYFQSWAVWGMSFLDESNNIQYDILSQFNRPYAYAIVGTPLLIFYDRINNTRCFTLKYTIDLTITCPSQMYLLSRIYPRSYGYNITLITCGLESNVNTDDPNLIDITITNSTENGCCGIVEICPL